MAYEIPSKDSNLQLYSQWSICLSANASNMVKPIERLKNCNENKSADQSIQLMQAIRKFS